MNTLFDIGLLDINGKGMERFCGSFQVQVPVGTEIYLYKKGLLDIDIQIPGPEEVGLVIN